MTVSSPTARNDYIGNGVTLQFPVTFRFLENSHLRVLRTVIATNVTTDLILNSLGPDGYSVTGAGQPSGGTVTVITAPDATQRLSILRNVPITQLTDYISNDAFPAESHERALDKLTMIVGQQNEVVQRAVVLPPQTTGVSNELPGPEALKLLRWKADETGLENVAPPAIATVADGAVVDATVSPIAGIQSTKLSYTQSGASVVARDVQDRLRDDISVFDFMTPAERADVRSGAATLNHGPAIQSAIDNIATRGGGVLLFPEGVYRATSQLVITNGVTLQGCGAVPYTNTGTIQPRGGGTWFHFDHPGVGIVATPAGGSPVGSGAVIRGIGTFRTHAVPGGGWVPTVYDWDIQDIGMDLTVEDVTVLNAYRGITITSAGFGRLWLNRVRMQAFNEGVLLEFAADTCHLDTVHIWPFWSQNANVTNYTLANLTAYRIIRADNAVMNKCFQIYANRGIVVDGDGIGNTTHHLRIDNSNMDPCAIPVQFTALADGCSVRISNMIAQCSPSAGGSTLGVQVLCDNARIELDNCNFDLAAANGITVMGTGNRVRAALLTITNWDQSVSGFTAVNVAAGNTFEFEGRPLFSGGGASLVFGGAGAVYGNLGAGLIDTSTSAGGEITVVHGLRVQPKGVFLQTALGLNHVITVTALTSTSFTARWILANTGAVVASTPVAAYWHADMF